MNKSLIVLALAAVLILLGVLIFNPNTFNKETTEKEGDEAVVVRVIDGDTIEVDLKGELIVVRYLGIDSPERNKCYSDEATAKNKALVGGKIVRLEKDQTDKDAFGRLLRYVFLDEENIFVNELLIQEGYAEVYDSKKDIKYQLPLSLSEIDARDGKKGLWLACEEPEVPPYYPQ